MLLALFLFGCDPVAPNEHEINFASKFGDTLIYFKDARTGLCFAGRSLGTNWGSMTAVPCTPEVEKLLVKP